MTRLLSFLRSEAPPPNGAFGLLALERLADPVVACDADGTLVMFNRSARELHGLPAERLPPSEWAQHYHLYHRGGERIDDPEEIPLTRALRGEEIRDVEIEIRPRRSEPHILACSGGPVRDAHGTIVGAAVVMREVTARAARDEELLLQSAIARNVADGIALIGASDGNLVYVNRTWERMFGYDAVELLGRHISTVNAPVDDSPEERAQEIIGALERDGVWRGQIHNRRKDGSLFWTAADVSRFEHPVHGTVWMALQREITKAKADDEERREVLDRLRTAFELSPIGLALVDSEQRLIDVNRLACGKAGRDRAELLGRPLAELVDPDAVRVNTVRGPDGRPLYGIAVIDTVKDEEREPRPG